MMRNPRELVLLSPAEESQAPHDVELLRVQQVQSEAARVEDHVVAVIELVDVDRQPRNGRHDRGADGGIGNHAVLLAVVLRCNRYNRRRQIAQELVGEGGLTHTSRYMPTVASLP